MTGPEHIVAWIESSKPHYDRLLSLRKYDAGARSNRLIACAAFNLAADAYSEMVKGGDAYASDHDASTILGAALALSVWKLEE